jgi:hypothetical protein
VDNELSNINSWREVHEKDEAALRPSIQDICSGMKSRKRSWPYLIHRSAGDDLPCAMRHCGSYPLD